MKKIALTLAMLMALTALAAPVLATVNQLEGYKVYISVPIKINLTDGVRVGSSGKLTGIIEVDYTGDKKSEIIQISHPVVLDKLDSYSFVLDYEAIDSVLVSIDEALKLSDGTILKLAHLDEDAPNYAFYEKYTNLQDIGGNTADTIKGLLADLDGLNGLDTQYYSAGTGSSSSAGVTATDEYSFVIEQKFAGDKADTLPTFTYQLWQTGKNRVSNYRRSSSSRSYGSYTDLLDTATTNRKSFTLGTVEFPSAGTYTFEVKETKGSAKGWTYDTAIYEYEIVVKADSAGALYIDDIDILKIVGEKESYIKKDSDVVFTNTYKKSSSSNPKTADNTHVILWTAMALASLAAVVTLRRKSLNNQ